MSEPNDPDELAKAVGYALHEWSMVENDLAHLFAGLLDAPGIETPHIIMASIASFEARLHLVNVFVTREPLLADQQATWGKLSNKITKAYRSRHQIAHFSFVSAYLDDERVSTVVQPFFSMGTIMLDRDIRLGVSEVTDKRRRFEAIREAVSWFARYLNMRRYSPEADHLPEPDLILHLQSLAGRSPEE